jgi:hypothetical protein
MPQSDYGGLDVLVTHTDDYAYFYGTTPQGRAAFDGSTPARIYGMRAFVSGRFATRNVELYIGSSPRGTGVFSRASAGSAQDTGYVGCSFLTTGAVEVFYIDMNGSCYIGRASGSGGFDSYGSIGGPPYMSLLWTQSPTAPLSLAVSPSATTADLTWAAPTDNGGDALTGYRIFYGTSPTLAGAATKDIAGGATTSDTVTGLTPGVQYYFGISARNAVTNLAATVGVRSTIVAGFTGTVPGAPLTPAVTAVPGGIAVTWTPPASDGGIAIDSYIVRIATDAGFTTAVADHTANGGGSRSKTIVGLTPGTTYYAKVYAHNTLGNGTASSSVNTATPARTALDLVKGAALHLADGTQIEVRSDAANAPVLTLGYIPLGTASTFTSIAALPVGATSSSFAALGGPRNIALVADPDGNIYVIGRRGDDASTVYVRRYERTGPTTWVLDGTLSGTLASTGDTLAAFAAAYVPGDGVVAPTPTALLLARRVGTVGAGALSYGTINLANVAASSGALFIESGSDPTWLGTPPAGAALNSGVVDATPLVSGGKRLGLLGNGYAVVDVTNGVVTGVAKAANGLSVAGPWARVLGVSAGTLAVLSVSGGALTWAVYSTAGSLLGSGSYAGANAFGGSFSNQWDAFYDRVAGVITAAYVADNAGARQLESIDISPTTYAAAAAVVLTAALGAASTTNSDTRVPAGVVDERRVLIAAANIVTATSVKSVAAYVDTSGNVAPNAPALVDEAGYDATAARVFAWAFSDPNSADAQTAYQLQIQRVSDSVDIVDSGKVVSAVASRTVAANALVNGVNYRWRVRTYDALDSVSSWSSYDTFTVSAIGTLTVTSPAADNPAGIDTSSLNIAWSYVQANGYVQTQRRVRVLRVSDSVVLSDTTMQASAVANYTVTGLPTGVQVRIEVSIVTNAPGTPTVGPSNRLLTSTFDQPMTPTIVLTTGVSYIEIEVDNPVPSGDRPEVDYNLIDRRVAGTQDAFVAIAQIVRNGTYRDHAVRSDAEYDYRVRGVSI